MSNSNANTPSRPTPLALSEPEIEAKLIEAQKIAAAASASSLKPMFGEATGLPRPISDEAYAQRQAMRQESDRQRKVERLLLHCGVSARYLAAKLDSFDHLPATVRAVYQKKASSLIAMSDQPVIIGLVGPRGPGKTYMASAIVLAACRAGRSAKYAVTMDYFQHLKSQYRDGGDSSRIEREYDSPSLLVLDEIQVRGETEWENRTLTNLIDKRYRDLKTTILITNETVDQFMASVGTSVASRITDGGAVIECNWPSLRGAKP